ncbi:MAG: F0F1 ATP synthase subunit B [Fibrobacterota bacterium]|nr:F0F1 ATP synthase subunit B [Fibrobacterota bacterium]
MKTELSGELLAQATADGHAAPAAGETHAEVAHGAGDAGSLPPFLRFDPGVWIWTMLVFVALLLILKKMAWKPIIASLDEREKTIRDSLDQAARIQEESKRITEEQNKILAAARIEANAMLQSSKQAADDLRRKLEQSAQEEKARIIASATAEIESSKRAAMAELKRTTADLSIRIAEKLIQASLDDTKQRALVDQLINEVSTARS